MTYEPFEIIDSTCIRALADYANGRISYEEYAARVQAHTDQHIFETINAGFTTHYIAHA